MEILIILAFLPLCGAVTGGAIIFLTFRLNYWKNKFYDRDDDFKGVLERAVEAETKKSEIETEMKFQKQTLLMLANSLQNKEIVAVLNDTQVQRIVQCLGQLVSSVDKKPEELN